MTSTNAEKINEILAELSADTHSSDVYGLIALQTDDPGLVLIRDCGTAFLFDAKGVIESLKCVEEVDWSYDCAEQSMQPVWDAIAGCQV